METETDTLDRIGCELVAEALRAGHEVRVRVAGSSMVPALWPGDELLIRSLGLTEPSPGALLLFVSYGRLCTHRLIGTVDNSGGPQFVTRGDALAKVDPPMPCSEVLGYVSAVIRDGRRIPMALNVPSRAARMLSFAIRNSSLLRRLILGLYARRHSYWMFGRCPG